MRLQTDITSAAQTALAAAQTAATQAQQAYQNSTSLAVDAYNPNLYSDPTYEYATVGGTFSWGASALPVVTTSGATRLRTLTTAASLTIADSSVRRIPVASLPNGVFSASIVIASKPVTTAGEIRIRVTAYDASGATISASNLWTTTGNDYPSDNANNYTRYVPTNAITSPTELVIAQGVPIPASAVYIGLSIRLPAATSNTMDFSHICVRNGSDPYFRFTVVSPKAVADNTTANATNSSNIVAVQTSINNFASSLTTNAVNPNLYTDPELEYQTSGSTMAWFDRSLNIVTDNGFKRIQSPSLSSAASVKDAASRRVPVSSFPNGIVSASVLISTKATTAAGDIRCRLVAYDSSGTSISGWPLTNNDDGSSSFYSRYVPTTAITQPTELVIASGIAIPSGAAYIGFEIRVATTVTMNFSNICIRNGADANYRPAQVSPKAVADNTANIASVNAKLLEDFPDIASQFPNQFLAGELDVTQALRCNTTANNPSPSTFGSDNRPCWNISVIANKGPSEQGTFMGPYPVSGFAGHTNASFAVQVYSADTYTGSTGANLLRFLVMQYSTSGEITAARQQLSVATTGGVSTPTWFRATNFAIDPSCDHLYVYIGMNNSTGTSARSMKFGDMLLCAGSNSTFRRPPSGSTGSGTGGGVAYVSTTGSDSNLGTISNPFATIQAAINSLGGCGTIYVANGTYGGDYGVSQNIISSTITGKIKIIGARAASPNYDTYPIIYLSSKLTSITKTSGYSKVYQKTLTSPPTLANFNWAYQDGVADPRTVIALADRSPEHRGRSNRLMFGTKLLKSTATALTSAKDDIEADGSIFSGYINGTTLTITDSSGMLGSGLSVGRVLTGAGLITGTRIESLGTGSGGVGTYSVNFSQNAGSSGSPITLTLNDPRAWIDDSTGIMYFSIVGGGDATAATIMVDASSLTTYSTRESAGEIEIQGMEIRYGGLDLRTFKSAYLNEVFVHGGKINAIDYSNLTYGTIEASCSGSIAGSTGDCLNGHYGAKLLGLGTYYGHDGQDDAWSAHEGCTSRMMGGGLTEYCGGTGFAPAYGEDHISAYFIHRRNQYVTGRKPAQVAVVGYPSGSDSTDAGVDTNAIFWSHVTIGGTIGFQDSGSNGTEYARANCINCTALEYSAYGYSVSAPIQNCYSKSNVVGSQAKSAGTTVNNSTLVT